MALDSSRTACAGKHGCDSSLYGRPTEAASDLARALRWFYYRVHRRSYSVYHFTVCKDISSKHLLCDWCPPRLVDAQEFLLPRESPKSVSTDIDSTLHDNCRRNRRLRNRNNKTKMANRPMHLTPMPSALLARRLRSRLWCQKQVGASDRGRSARIENPLTS